MSSSRTVPARKTELQTIDLDTASDFVAEYHRGGMAKSGKHVGCYGLYFENELLAVAVFANPRTKAKQRQYTTELFRLAFKDGIRVQGGASKLIKGYMKHSNTSALFTYQDTSGEVTDVYEKCGMTLVGRKWPKKRVLVKDGLTYSTAQNNRRDWFSMEQAARLGPDALIGTKLGEVHEDGKRVTNVELFKRSGYHLETIPGDRVYEWNNPQFKFYTYVITSTEDSNYYYGRHRTRLTTAPEMLCDGYMGSGGVKFKNWAKSVSEESLQKKILGVYDTWGESVKAEEELIGDKHKTDPHCKNSRPGGTGLTSYFPEYTLEVCPVHGEVKHRGGCKKCSVAQAQSLKDCSVHGPTIHIGDSCYKCVTAKTWAEKECPVHGAVLHQGDICPRCTYKSSVSLKECPTHGTTLHNGDYCATCMAQAIVSVENCPIHGETKYVGGECKKCMAGRTITQQVCPVHGETIFKGDMCCKCSAAKGWSVQTCEIHGETSHRGDKCEKCTQNERSAKKKSEETIEKCSVHGETAHYRGQCTRCKAQKQVSVQVCPIHGETKFNGPRCSKCAVNKIWTVETCPVHGETKHRSGRCERCARKAQWAARKKREEQESSS